MREQAFGARGSSPHRRRFAFDRAGSPVGIDDTIWGASAYSQDANGQTVEASHGVTRGVETGAERWYRDSGGAEEIERFAYDSARNIFASGGGEAWLTSVGGVVSAARGPQGERITLTHDSCGRVVERRVERDGFRPKHWAYEWDAFDRLIACETPEGARWTYAYDPFGRRIEKRGPRGAGSRFTWDGDVPVEDIPLDADGKPDYAARTDWHFLPGSFAPMAKVSGGRLSYVVTDHLGTPRELLSEKGELEWAASYRLWGSVRALRAKRRVNGGVEPDPEDAEVCPFRFPGQWADEETGLYYNRHRHYDPLVGQYASPDPIGLEGGDRPQGYVASPVCWVDPLGLTQSAWELAPGPRGETIERQLGQNLPQNFPVIDKFNNGRVTSIKSIDLNAKSYQDIRVLERKVKDYVNKVAKYQGTGGKRWAGVQIDPSQINARELDLAIPNSGSALRQQAIQNAVNYGSSIGVNVNTIVVH